jgi:hypothetical protein
MPKAAALFTVASCWVFCFLATEAEAQNERGCTNLRTLASMGPQVSDDRQDFETTTDRFRVTYEVDFKNDDPLEFRDFTVDIIGRFGLPEESDSAARDRSKSFIVVADARKYSVETDVEPNNGATYTVLVEECSNPQGEPPHRGGTPGGETPGGDQYAPDTPPGAVDRPEGVIRRTPVRRVPFTGGPPIILGALALLGTAVIVGHGVLRR